MTSVIIVQHNHLSLTRAAIRSFREHHNKGYEIIVVDNASTQEDPRKLAEEFPDIQLLCNERNDGFSRANNRGAEVANGDLLFFLNNDTITQSNILMAVEEVFQRREEIGVIGPALRYPDGRFQLSAGRLPTFAGEMVDKVVYGLLDRRIQWVEKRAAASYSSRRDVGWVTGAALFIRRDMFLQVGGFDEEFFMYFEDKDLCARVLNAGKKVCYFPGVSLVHLKAGSSSGSQAQTAREYRKSQLRYYKKHRTWIEIWALGIYLRMAGKSPL